MIMTTMEYNESGCGSNGIDTHSRLYKLRTDPGIEEVAPRIFFSKYVTLTPPSKWDSLTIKELMTLWGYTHHYEAMIERFKRLIKENPYADIVVHYECGGLKKEMEHQKLLGWAIYYSDTKSYGLVGGVLFQNGEMSFHT